MREPVPVMESLFDAESSAVKISTVTESRFDNSLAKDLFPGSVALSARAKDLLNVSAKDCVICYGDPRKERLSDALILRVIEWRPANEHAVIDVQSRKFFSPDTEDPRIDLQFARPNIPTVSNVALKYDGERQFSDVKVKIKREFANGWEFVTGQPMIIPGRVCNDATPFQVEIAQTSGSAALVRCENSTQIALGEQSISVQNEPVYGVNFASVKGETTNITTDEATFELTGKNPGHEMGENSTNHDNNDKSDTSCVSDIATAGDEGIQQLGNVGVTFNDVAGLDDEINELQKLIRLPFEYPAVFNQFELDKPTGVLLHGPPGTGKSLLAEAVSNEVDAEFRQLSATEVKSRYVGESGKRLKSIFDEERESDRPSIIFIDEIDALAPDRSQNLNDSQQGAVTQLLRSMDGLDADDNIVVVAATNKPDSLDEALRRGGRFDKEIEIGVPDEEGRREIIELYLSRIPNCGLDKKELVKRTRGYVGADVDQLFREAAIVAIERHIDVGVDSGSGELHSETLPPQRELEGLRITGPDIDAALKTVEPSGMREFFVEVPSTTWNDIGGLVTAKRELQKVVEWPLVYSDVYDSLKINTGEGVLLHGPPGTGKTLLARAVANESNANFISIRGPELVTKHVGETEAKLRDVFERARTNAPTIVFFDEIDAIAGDRLTSADSSGVTGRVVSQLLTEMDGLGTQRDDVDVIATTNRKNAIDDALLRAGRFSKHIHVPPPEHESRQEIFRVHLQDRPTSENISISELASETEGYVGADIEQVVEESANLVAESIIEHRQAIDESRTDKKAKIKMEDLKKTISNFEPVARSTDKSKNVYDSYY